MIRPPPAWWRADSFSPPSPSRVASPALTQRRISPRATLARLAQTLAIIPFRATSASGQLRLGASFRSKMQPITAGLALVVTRGDLDITNAQTVSGAYALLRFASFDGS